MTKTLDAVYESGGILKLLEPLDLRERTPVRVIVQSLDEPIGSRHRRIRRVPPGAGAFDSGHTDTAERAEELLGELGFNQKFDDLGLGFVDAAVIAIAETLNLLRVATADRRHFGALARELKLELLP